MSCRAGKIILTCQLYPEISDTEVTFQNVTGKSVVIEQIASMKKNQKKTITPKAGSFSEGDGEYKISFTYEGRKYSKNFGYAPTAGGSYNVIIGKGFVLRENDENNNSEKTEEDIILIYWYIY